MANKKLRCGFTTGAAAAAAGLASYLSAIYRPGLEAVDLLFPDGRLRRLPVRALAEGEFEVVKDAGDDPDITDKARIRALFSRPASGRPGANDYLLEIGRGQLILTAAGGVGLCRRSGLDCELNRWAINLGPRRMIRENLARAGFGARPELGRLVISVVRGRELARKTLNRKLGICDGISILGTSGIVYPYSHQAYIRTITVLVRAVAEDGGREVVFCTGGRSLKAAQHRRSDLPETAFIRIGDFIYDSLIQVVEQGLKQVTIACMPGKLCKYAAGFHNTHAANVEQTLAPLLAAFTGAPEKKNSLAACRSVREALELMSAAERQTALEILAAQAAAQLRGWHGELQFSFLVFDFAGKLLLTLP